MGTLHQLRPEPSYALKPKHQENLTLVLSGLGVRRATYHVARQGVYTTPVVQDLLLRLSVHLLNPDQIAYRDRKETFMLYKIAEHVKYQDGRECVLKRIKRISGTSIPWNYFTSFISEHLSLVLLNRWLPIVFLHTPLCLPDGTSAMLGIHRIVKQDNSIRPTFFFVPLENSEQFKTDSFPTGNCYYLAHLPSTPVV